MGDEMGELCVQPKGGGSRGIDSRHLVHKIGEPHEVLVVVEIEAPHGVVDHLITDVDLFCQRLLREIENRSPKGEILVEFILRVQTEQRLPLHAEERLVFESHADVGAGVYDALVGDGHDTHAVVYGIIAVFRQLHAPGSHHDRTTRHVHGSEPDCGPSRCLIFSGKREFVFISKLARHDERGIIKLLEDVLGSESRVPYFLFEMAAKRFGHRKDDFAVGGLDGVAIDVVEKSVGIRFLIGVDAVEIHHLKEGLI